MKSLAALTVLLALSAAPVARGQLPYFYQPGYAGPVGPYVYTPYSPTPIYYNPQPYSYYGYGGGGYYESDVAYEVRQLRYSVEDAAFQRRWRNR
jgi:hypothetical protein